MFYGASAFNQDVSSWNTSSVTNMQATFENASIFNQNVGSWSIPLVTNMVSMLDNSGITSVNYDATLAGWSGQTVQPNVTLGAAGIYYLSSAVASRTVLTGSPNNWTINDAGETVPATYAVTYAYGGGAGTLPTQTNEPSAGTFVVASGSGLSRTGYNFAGWNDGTSTYQPNATYTMGSSAVTLTAVWDTVTVPTSPSGGFTFTVIGGDVTITGCSPSTCPATLIIPSSIGGDPSLQLVITRSTPSPSLR
jgi:surface protein